MTIIGLESSFTYDELNRLTRSKVTHLGQEYISDIVYDDNNYGCIKSKTAAYIGAPGLINMNGRMYDPVLGSFLSPDNYIQNPDNSQSFNRYAYCLNNPLRYVDPDGEFFTWSINQQGFSVGLNFTPAGYPLGFGINVGWANGGSFGFYGEVAYRVGGQGVGLGFGAGFQACIDFSTNGINPSVSTFASATFGGLSVGDSAGYSWGNKSAFWGVNIGLGLGDNSGNLGGGFSLGYGSGGWSWGINGYYNKMQRASLTETGETVSVASDAPALKQNSIDDCHETVIRWQESTSFGEEMLNNETIAHCIVHSEQENGGNYFGRSSIKYASYKRHVKLTLYADDGDSGKKPLNRATYGEIYNCIQEEGRSIIGLETEVGHPIGVKSMTPTTRVNIWGKQTNGYRIVVMDPSYGQFRTMFFYNTSGIKSVATFMYKPIMN